MYMSFAGGLAVKDPPAGAGDTASVPESGGSSGEVDGNPLRYSCLGNPRGRGAGWVIVHAVSKESDLTEQLNNINKVCYKRISIIRLVHTSSTSYNYPFLSFCGQNI